MRRAKPRTCLILLLVAVPLASCSASSCRSREAPASEQPFRGAAPAPEWARAAAATASGTAGSASALDRRTADHDIIGRHTAMGTEIELSAWAEDEIATGKAFELAFAELDRVDRLMTTWIPDSDISRINAAAGDGKPVAVTDEVIYVLQRSAEASRLTGGAFDITVGSFAGVWKFDQDNDGTIPDPKIVEERKSLVSWKDVIVDEKAKSVRLARAGQKVTLGGIAKGYAVDRAVEILRKQGLVNFMVQAGGDMFVAGRHGERKWRVGIRDPRGARDVYFAAAEIEDMSFSTSGDYERYVIKDGKRYHHIIDPQTGYPADKCRSVTVMAHDATTAEGLTKGIFILGAEKGMALIDGIRDVGAVVVDSNNQVHVSKRLAGKVGVLAQPTEGI